MKLIVCRGGDKAVTPYVVERTGILYGIRDDYTPYAPVWMIDFDWSNPATPPRWSKFIDLLRRHQPGVAMAPDYESPEQQKNLYRQIDEIRSLGVQPMVCPKFDGAVSDIPNDVIVAVSVPTEYAGFLPTPEELRGRNLHFLGGHADQWAYLMLAYSEAVIVSGDMNTPIGWAQQYGKFWSHEGRYIEMRGQGFDSDALAVASVRNVQRYLDSNPQVFRSERVAKCRHELAARTRQILPSSQLMLAV